MGRLGRERIYRRQGWLVPLSCSGTPAHTGRAKTSSSPRLLLAILACAVAVLVEGVLHHFQFLPELLRAKRLLVSSSRHTTQDVVATSRSASPTGNRGWRKVRLRTSSGVMVVGEKMNNCQLQWIVQRQSRCIADGQMLDVIAARRIRGASTSCRLLSTSHQCCRASVICEVDQAVERSARIRKRRRIDIRTGAFSSAVSMCVSRLDDVQSCVSRVR